MSKTGAKERIRSERQEASQHSPFSALPKATPGDFCVHLFDQVGVTWSLLFPHGTRQFCISAGHSALPRPNWGAIGRKKKRNRYWAGNWKSWQQYLRERGGILYLEKNRSLYVSLIRTSRERKIACVAGFPVEFHREIRIVPPCMLSSSQIYCPCSPSRDHGPSAVQFYF